MTTWRTIRDAIDNFNNGAMPGRTIQYHLRKNQQGPFDIQVHYDDLSDATKQYIRYREGLEKYQSNVIDITTGVRQPG